jgi:hypothetical protein
VQTLEGAGEVDVARECDQSRERERERAYWLVWERPQSGCSWSSPEHGLSIVALLNTSEVQSSLEMFSEVPIVRFARR